MLRLNTYGGLTHDRKRTSTAPRTYSIYSIYEQHAEGQALARTQRSYAVLSPTDRLTTMHSRNTSARGRLGRARLCSRLCDASRNGSACVAHRLRTSAKVKSLVKNPVTGCPFGRTCRGRQGQGSGRELGTRLDTGRCQVSVTTSHLRKGCSTLVAIGSTLVRRRWRLRVRGQRVNDDGPNLHPEPWHSPEQ